MPDFSNTTVHIPRCDHVYTFERVDVAVSLSVGKPPAGKGVVCTFKFVLHFVWCDMVSVSQKHLILHKTN